MGLAYFLRDNIFIEINTAAKAELLTAINEAGIHIWNVVSPNELVVQGTIRRRDQKSLCELLEKRCESMSSKERSGLYVQISSLCRRPILILTVVFIIFLSVFIPTRILFIQVEGNRIVPTNRIVECASNAGVSVGTLRRSIHSERIKNALLSSMPELQWAGVNTYGCVAKITVKENVSTNLTTPKQGPASIVSRCDGIIEAITVTRGTPLCSVGQAVTKNQTLVSAYTDCGSVIKSTRAEAEIVGITYHTVVAFSPLNSQKRAVDIAWRKCYSLKIGKKLIKLYKDSGISDIRCAKISTEYPIKLPGGFLVPIALVQDEYVRSEFFEESLDPANSLDWLSAMIEQYHLSQMRAGDILQKKYSSNISADTLVISAEYLCREMIGMVREEETDFYGKRN